MKISQLAVLVILSAPGLVSADADEVVLYSSSDDYETVRENLEFAIINQGLVINNVLHIGDMLARTGQDLGHETVYLHAESFAFCSAQLSYRMMAMDARNITVCPYTVSVYVTTAKPSRVYVAYQKPNLMGAAQTLRDEITELLDTIASEAVGD